MNDLADAYTLSRSSRRGMRPMPVSDTTCNKVLAALNEHWVKHYAPPSLRELMDATGINSTSMVSNALCRLNEKDLVMFGGTKYTARTAIPVWVIYAIDSFRERWL